MSQQSVEHRPHFAAEPLWVPPPDRVAASSMEQFRLRASAAVGEDLAGTADLHRWSVNHPEQFWALLAAELWPSVEVGDAVMVPGGHLAATGWFPDARLNVAEIILHAGPENAVMLVDVDETGRRRELTRGAARAEVARVAAALRAAGVEEGDRVAAWMPNTVETVVLMLAAASMGAVFSSTSPDFGADGVLDRFGQIRPKVLVATDGYSYGGRRFDRAHQLAEIVRGLTDLRQVVVLASCDRASPDDTERPGRALEAVGRSVPDAPSVADWDEWLEPHGAASLTFTPLPFDHPWYVLYSSGTTGVPKCIVHRAGGVLLQHMKEHRLHLDIRPGDFVCYFTTCGWMMWNWLASVPASGATAVLYDGNPFHPGPERLWDLVAEEALALLGVSAKYLDSVRASGYRPADSTDLSSLRTLCSTGSPLSPEGFEWVMGSVAPGCGPDGLHLASISGGTDLCGCFVLGDPTRPVYAGEIQAPALGMAVEVWGDDGRPLGVGERGELVCTAPFPSVPLAFWDDGTPGVGQPGVIGPRFSAAYFERFDGVWAHGDFATWTPHGGMVIHGRSDTTLNPGGVRIGTAEIYRQVEQVPEVVESLVFGQEISGPDGSTDVRIVLLVRLADDVALSDELVAAIKQRVRDGCTPRHVPSVVVAVEDLPRTRSGKLAELAVADIVNGREVRNTTALANPECLDAIAAAVPSP